MSSKFRQRQLRDDYILMRVATVVLALLAVAFLVIIGVMIATFT
jgi:succinate dehydrogenase hydrophobic anchor subunit